MEPQGLGKESHFYKSLEGKKEKQKSSLIWLNTTVKQELVTPAMLSFLYTKAHQLYRHHHKKIITKIRKWEWQESHAAWFSKWETKTLQWKKSRILWGNIQL